MMILTDKKLNLHSKEPNQPCKVLVIFFGLLTGTSGDWDESQTACLPLSIL